MFNAFYGVDIKKWKDIFFLFAFLFKHVTISKFKTS